MTRKALIFIISLTFLFPTISFSSDQFRWKNFRYPKKYEKKRRMKLWATYYYVYTAKALRFGGYPLLNRNGQAFSPMLSKKDWCLGAIEGTVRVKTVDFEVLTYNYATRGNWNVVDCRNFARSLPYRKRLSIGKIRYKLSSGKYGEGVKNMHLIPYRTIAVDPRKIRYGSIVFIPAARGKRLKLPSGKIIRHDGYFYAADTGSAIRWSHIDIFSGVSKSNPFPRFVRSRSSRRFTAYIVRNYRIRRFFRKIHQQY
ncbi:MAG: 3D (Asp-Asp-Asp) domain-containing protein [bacterium]|jgi:3D (Asp-Asp-Asp) domain-containing protein